MDPKIVSGKKVSRRKLEFFIYFFNSMKMCDLKMIRLGFLGFGLRMHKFN